MGSFSSLVASPLLATYAGSKAFLTTWTQSLADEVANDGITVRLLNTYFVVSALSKIRRSSAMIPMPRPYVRSVLSTIGRPGGGRARPYTSNPYWSHALLEYGIHLLNLPSVVIAYTSCSSLFARLSTNFQICHLIVSQGFTRICADGRCESRVNAMIDENCTFVRDLFKALTFAVCNQVCLKDTWRVLRLAWKFSLVL